MMMSRSASTIHVKELATGLRGFVHPASTSTTRSSFRRRRSVAVSSQPQLAPAPASSLSFDAAEFPPSSTSARNGTVAEGSNVVADCCIGHQQHRMRSRSADFAHSRSSEQHRNRRTGRSTSVVQGHNSVMVGEHPRSTKTRTARKYRRVMNKYKKLSSKHHHHHLVEKSNIDPNAFSRVQDCEGIDVHLDQGFEEACPEVAAMHKKIEKDIDAILVSMSDLIAPDNNCLPSSRNTEQIIDDDDELRFEEKNTAQAEEFLQTKLEHIKYECIPEIYLPNPPRYFTFDTVGTIRSPFSMANIHSHPEKDIGMFGSPIMLGVRGQGCFASPKV